MIFASYSKCEICLKYIINYQSRDKRMSNFPMFFTWNIINGSSIIYDIIINCGNKSGMLIQTSTSKYVLICCKKLQIEDPTIVGID